MSEPYNMNKHRNGKVLAKLHAWNAWALVVLALTGIALFIPAVRGDMAGISIRPAIKTVHIGAGIVSILLLLGYLPYLSRHVRQIRKRKPQLFNLALVLLLITGWAASGLVLANVRNVNPGAASVALRLHDLLTWIGLPWVVYHSVSRSRRFRRLEAETGPIEKEASLSERYDPPLVTRRQFVRFMLGAGLAVVVGPPFWRWLKTHTPLFGGESIHPQQLADANRMLPVPEPLAESLQPIGGGAAGQFRIYTVTDIPHFDSETWQFKVYGLVEKPLTFTWEDFLQLPREAKVNDFHCVTGWSVLHCTWEGIPISRLLELAGVQSRARYAVFRSGDGVYTDSLSLDQLQAEGVMAAVLLDGRPISNRLGGPVRLIVPGMYAYKSVKWLQAIELTDQDHTGYWEQRGYDKDAWV